MMNWKWNRGSIGIINCEVARVGFPENIGV
jgi:hypothetical protein